MASYEIAPIITTGTKSPWVIEGERMFFVLIFKPVSTHEDLEVVIPFQFIGTPGGSSADPSQQRPFVKQPVDGIPNFPLACGGIDQVDLDPTVIGDVMLLTFAEGGKAVPAEPDGWQHDRAAVSIERYKLNGYPPLSRAREQI